MTPHVPPGGWLLRLARRLFEEPIVRSVVEPAIADFQHELAHAGPHVGRRFAARLRGYLAFWRLVLLVPFVTPGAMPVPVGAPGGPADPGHGMLLLAAIVTVPLVITIYVAMGWPILAILLAGLAASVGIHVWHTRRTGPAPRTGGLQFASIPTSGSSLTLVIAAGGVVLFVAATTSWLALLLAAGAGSLAVVLHAWHARHPARLPLPRSTPRHPEINFAAIQVMENMAGLLVVVGSVSIIAAGLTPFRWFLLATCAGGMAVAIVLSRWRRTHPTTRALASPLGLR